MRLLVDQARHSWPNTPINKSFKWQAFGKISAKFSLCRQSAITNFAIFHRKMRRNRKFRNRVVTAEKSQPISQKESLRTVWPRKQIADFDRKSSPGDGALTQRTPRGTKNTIAVVNHYRDSNSLHRDSNSLYRGSNSGASFPRKNDSESGVRIVKILHRGSIFLLSDFQCDSVFSTKGVLWVGTSRSWGFLKLFWTPNPYNFSGQPTSVTWCDATLSRTSLTTHTPLN